MTLTSGELADIRAAFRDQILDTTCTIYAVTRTPDGAGGQTETLTTVAEDVACRFGVERRRGQADERAARQVYPDGYVLDVANTQTLAEGNRVVVGGVTYQVVWVEDAVQWQFLKTAHLRAFDG